MQKMRENFFWIIFFTRGDPYDFSGFFDVFLFRKHSKMTFLEKKFQGCLKICLRNDLFFVKLKSEQKNFKFFLKFFSWNSQFSSSENDPRKSKIQKKNSVQHLKMYLRYHMPKIRHFWWWEPKNLWPPACIFSLLNIIPQDLQTTKKRS